LEGYFEFSGGYQVAAVGGVLFLEDGSVEIVGHSEAVQVEFPIWKKANEECVEGNRTLELLVPSKDGCVWSLLISEKTCL
jgi:hypothetical protein